MLHRIWVLLLFATFAMLSCQTRVVPNPEVGPPVVPPVVDTNEVVIKAVAPSVSVSSASPSTRALLPDVFSSGHTVGLYTRWKDDPVATNVLQANSYYLFSDPTWTPSTKSDKLLYHTLNYPIYIYGYHPFVRVAGSSTSFASATDSLNIRYSVKRNFSTLDSLRMADFMWSKATGVDASGNPSNAGYIRQGKAINMSFRHKLCKVSFLVKVTDSHPTATSPTTFKVTKLWLDSEDLNVAATLNVISGDMSYEPCVSTDSLVWNPSDGVDVSIGGGSAFVTDMVVIPFSVVGKGTRIKVKLESADGGVAYFTTIVPVYNGVSWPDAPSGNKIRFAENDYNKITLTLDASSLYMQLDCKIEPWGEGNHTELKPDDRD